MRRHQSPVVLAVLVTVLLPVLVLLLPIILPAVAAADALEMRRLARSRCPRCGETFGMAEVRRARESARSEVGARVASAMAMGRRPRVVVNWQITCPTCGQAYICTNGAGSRRTLSPEPSR